MTLYDALLEFQDLYLTRLSDSSRRISDPIATDWQKISNEYNLYYQAIAGGDYTTGSDHLQNIIDLLAANDLIVDEPVIVPLPLSIYGSPATIQVPVDIFGLNPVFTNAYSYIYVYMGGVDDSANWTYTITGTTNVTASFTDNNKLNITGITDDTGFVTMEVSKGGYTTLNFVILVNKVYDPQSGISIDAYPSTIFILCDSFGVPITYTTAISELIIREGVTDVTSSWNFAIFSQTNVTATITGTSTISITNITDDQGDVTVRLTRTDYPTYDVYVPVQKQYLPEDGLSINLYPDTIIIPCDQVGTPLSYAQAYSTIIIRNGIDDETSSWTISITGVTNVTANISGGNQLNITNISADEGTVDIECTRSGYPTQNFTVHVQKQLQGSALIGSGSVDDITIGLNGLSQLEVKDDGISTLKIDTANVFDQPGSLIEYDIDGSSYILVPTIVRRALGTYNSLESSHSIGYGIHNVVLGTGNILGPSDDDTTYSTQYYDYVGKVIFLNISEGDVSSAFAVDDKVLVWNSEDDGSILGYDDNYRYYVGGTVVSSAYSGQTYITITEDFVVDDFVYNYILNNGGSGGTIVTARYTDNGVPYTRYGNFIIGHKNKINGSGNIVIGDYWSNIQGPDVSGTAGNIFIGGNPGNPIEGNLNTFIVYPSGNNYTLTHHEDSVLNFGVGAAMSFGSSSDTVGRKMNVAIGVDNYILSSGSIGIGHYCRSYTDGEFVIANGDQYRRKVMLQLSANTTSTSDTELLTYNDTGTFGSSFVTPSHFYVTTDSIFSFRIDLLGIQSNGDVYRRRIIGLIRNDSGTTSLVGSLVEDSSFDITNISGTTYSITANDTTDELVVKITPGNVNSIKWLAWVEGNVIEF